MSDGHCCCCCSHINSHNQVRGHRTGSSHSGAEEYPREKHTQPKVVHAYITADAIHASPETYKSEIGSQSTMCQVQAGQCGAYVSLLTPGETKYSDCHPSKTTTYILHVVSITTHTHDRHKSIGEKETRKRKEDIHSSGFPNTNCFYGAWRVCTSRFGAKQTRQKRGAPFHSRTHARISMSRPTPCKLFMRISLKKKCVCVFCDSTGYTDPTEAVSTQ